MRDERSRPGVAPPPPDAPAWENLLTSGLRRSSGAGRFLRRPVGDEGRRSPLPELPLRVDGRGAHVRRFAALLFAMSARCVVR